MGFLVYKHIAGNIKEFYSINESVAVLVIKLNRGYKLKVVQAHSPTSSHDGQLAESYYEDVESAMSRVTSTVTVLIGDLNAKAGTNRLETMWWGNMAKVLGIAEGSC